MRAHLRASLWLLALSFVICGVVYPLILWGIGQAVFPSKAAGSLITAPDGSIVGSRLIAQPFSGDEYFQPRPSAASFNGAASAASNWGASNYLLRDRVARQLGPLVKYQSGPKRGRAVAPDVEQWFKSKKDIVAAWAKQHAGVAAAWVNADDKHKAAVAAWAEKHAEAVAEWKKSNPDAGEPKPADLAAAYFTDYSAIAPVAWPKLIDDATWSVAAVFFDMWLQEHPDVELERVPADMVMASGSGLDPLITLKNALYQLERVSTKWAADMKRDEVAVRKEIHQILNDHADAPLGGLVGPETVNVLEVNLALRDHFRRLDTAKR
jgi:K+-transporting ATPase ATPase C chain